MKNTLILLIFIMLTGCSGYYYTASPHYVPINSEKGELKANIGLNNLQAGYTISNHLSVFATGYFRYKVTKLNYETILSKENSGDDIYFDKSSEINIGGSYYYNFSKLTVEVLVGGGYGNLEFEHTIDFFETDYNFDMIAQKYNFFVQPNLGIRFNEHLDLNFSTRFSQQNLFNIKSSVEWGDYTDEAISDDYFFNKDLVKLYFLEPALTFRFGSQRFKMQTQIIPVFNLNDKHIRYKELSLFLSLYMSLNNL